MHPEVIRDEPGACPICGMALETVVPNDEQSEELTDFTRRMWISALAAVPLIVLTMGELVGLPFRNLVGHQIASYAEFLIATPIILWAARPFFARGVASVQNRSPNMWTLIALGVGAAYVYSLFATFLICDFLAKSVSRPIPDRRRGRNLLRSRGRYHRARLRWPGPRVACT